VDDIKRLLAEAVASDPGIIEHRDRHAGFAFCVKNYRKTTEAQEERLARLPRRGRTKQIVLTTHVFDRTLASVSPQRSHQK
jgi:hypothetical protein